MNESELIKIHNLLEKFSHLKNRYRIDYDYELVAITICNELAEIDVVVNLSLNELTNCLEGFNIVDTILTSDLTLTENLEKIKHQYIYKKQLFSKTIVLLNLLKNKLTKHVQQMEIIRNEKLLKIIKNNNNTNNNIISVDNDLDSYDIF